MDYSLPGGILLGLALGVTPGPVVTETVRRGAVGGLRSALGVALGAALGNVTVAALAMAGVGALLRLPGVATFIAVVGAAWILYLGIDSWRQAGRLAAGKAPGESGNRPELPAWLAGLLLVAVNPVVWAFWVAVLATAAGTGRTAGLGFALGFVAGISLADAALAVVSSRGSRLLGPRGQALALRICAVLLVGFAAAALVRCVTSPCAF